MIVDFITPTAHNDAITFYKNLLLDNCPWLTLVSDTGSGITRDIRFTFGGYRQLRLYSTNASYISMAFMYMSNTSTILTGISVPWSEGQVLTGYLITGSDWFFLRLSKFGSGYTIGIRKNVSEYVLSKSYDILAIDDGLDTTIIPPNIKLPMTHSMSAGGKEVLYPVHCGYWSNAGSVVPVSENPVSGLYCFRNYSGLVYGTKFQIGTKKFIVEIITAYIPAIGSTANGNYIAIQYE